MTPLETLAKYGLKTDVKSIKERIEKVDHFRIVFLSDTSKGLLIDEMSDESKELRTADLSLLCSLAEKGERYENAVNDLKALEICRHDAVDSCIENWEKSLHSAKIEACETIIAEAEGEGK